MKTRKIIKSCKRTYKKRYNIKKSEYKKGGVKEQMFKQSNYKVTTSTKYVNPKPKKKLINKNIPKLVIQPGDDEIHVYLNLLIDLMGSSLYDAFINEINKLHNLNIHLNPCKSNVKETAIKYILKYDSPAIFYGAGKDSTHFICTYDKAFNICKNKINPQTTIQSTRTIRNPCEKLKNCLWDPYENGGDSCTIYAGLQKSQAHSFCQTFTLSCMLSQYLPDFDLISDFKNMVSVNDTPDIITKNEMLSMNAFYAKNIACKIVRYTFLNNLSISHNGDVLDCWDFLFEQIEFQYSTTPELDNNNYMDFINYFLSFCENIKYEQFKNSTFINNVIYKT